MLTRTPQIPPHHFTAADTNDEPDIPGNLEDLNESPLEELLLNGCVGINGSLSDLSSSWLTAWSRLSTLGLADLHHVTGELQELQG